MMDRQLRRMIDEALADHELRKEPPSKSWRVGPPDGSSVYAFTVTWTPGVLALAGDLGELTLIHYNAMPTWQQAVQWADGAGVDYLLEKSNAKHEFDREGSITSLIHIADEDQKWSDGAPLWEKIFDKVSWYRVGRLDEGVCDLNPRNAAHQMMVAAALRQDSEIDDRWLYELGIDDFYGRNKWPDRAIWQVRALLLWARLVRPSVEIAEKAA